MGEVNAFWIAEFTRTGKPMLRYCFMTFLVVGFAAAQGGGGLGAENAPANATLQAVIDRQVSAELQAKNVTPAGQADEATILRRTMLDLIGRIPATVEVKAYLASKDPQKREKLVDRLMQSPEYGEHQAFMFDAFMTQGNSGIRAYLQKAIKENRRWDRVFRDVVIGDPKDPLHADATNFLRGRVKDVDLLTNDVSTVFFGVNVSCAKCHDHPLVADWKQDHFFGMKSFFNRTFASGNFLGERGHGEVSFKTTKGESRDAKLMFLTGTVVKEPKGKELSAKERRDLENKIKQLIKQKKAPPEPSFSRRRQLVETALKPGENRFFARSIVNRVWHQYFGYGLVMPLDQMHSANPASHPALLNRLADDLVAHGYDLRRLVRGVVLSNTYSRSSRWMSDDRPNRNLFAVAELKPLTPEQLARSLSLAAADPDAFADPKLKPQDRADRIAKAAGISNANIFEQPGENFQISADEALFFSNSAIVERTYLNGGLLRRLQQIKDPAKVVETAVWAVLSRSPSPEEIRLLGDYVRTRNDRPEQARRQIVWLLMAGSEFRFNY